MSYSRNSRANQQHGPSGEGTLTGRHGERPATVPAVPTCRRSRKALGWTGVRKRSWGGWATEIRIPRSRRTLWIGKFRCALEAALAYDAAMFCFYGEHPPRKRRFNFPAMQRPAIPDHLRIRLTIATIRAIATDYGRRCATLLAPLVCHVVSGALSAPPQMARVVGPDAPGAAAGVEVAAL
jgi:hypothetical protein